MKNQGPPEFYVALGQRIRSYREARNMTQESLAHQIGLGRTSITNIEKGAQQILAHQAVMLASALGVDLDVLLPAQIKGVSEEIAGLLPAGTSEQEKAWVLGAIVGADR